MSSQEQRRTSGYPGESAYAEEAGDSGEDLSDAESCPTGMDMPHRTDYHTAGT